MIDLPVGAVFDVDANVDEPDFNTMSRIVASQAQLNVNDTVPLPVAVTDVAGIDADAPAANEYDTAA